MPCVEPADDTGATKDAITCPANGRLATVDLRPFSESLPNTAYRIAHDGAPEHTTSYNFIKYTLERLVHERDLSLGSASATCTNAVRTLAILMPSFL